MMSERFHQLVVPMHRSVTERIDNNRKKISIVSNMLMTPMNLIQQWRHLMAQTCCKTMISLLRYIFFSEFVLTSCNLRGTFQLLDN